MLAQRLAEFARNHTITTAGAKLDNDENRENKISENNRKVALEQLKKYIDTKTIRPWSSHKNDLDANTLFKISRESLSNSSSSSSPPPPPSSGSSSSSSSSPPLEENMFEMSISPASDHSSSDSELDVPHLLIDDDNVESSSNEDSGSESGAKYYAPYDDDDGDGRTSFYISIEGVIGVGKTELTRKLSTAFANKFPGEICFALEESVNADWLNAFIENPVNMATVFQIKRLMETINTAKKTWTEMSVHRMYGTKVHCVGDRLPLGNFPFAFAHFANGNISPAMFNLYGLTLGDGGPYNYPDIVLLLCKPEISQARISMRDRKGESSYDIEYLRLLDEATLFTFLYIWYTDVVKVIPFDWNNFGSEEDIITVMQHVTWKDIEARGICQRLNMKTISELRLEVGRDILTMSRKRMSEIMYQLAMCVREAKRPCYSSCCL